jgi:DNA-binding GntR family transcriptional regulator
VEIHTALTRDFYKPHNCMQLHSLMREDTQQKAYEHIKDCIIGFRLKPNERLVASKLADELSISRTPVREALSRLEQEGLVGRSAGWGYAVREVGLTDVEDLFKVRESLEVLAVSEALRHMDAPTIAQLERLLRQASQCTGEPARFISFNRAFYSLIAVIARNELLRSLLSLINDKVQMIGAMTVRYQADRAQEILRENGALLSALKKKDETRALAAVRGHIRKGREYALRIIERQIPARNAHGRRATS